MTKSFTVELRDGTVINLKVKTSPTPSYKTSNTFTMTIQKGETALDVQFVDDEFSEFQDQIHAVQKPLQANTRGN